jgi:hypothetical protein
MGSMTVNLETGRGQGDVRVFERETAMILIKLEFQVTVYRPVSFRSRNLEAARCDQARNPIFGNGAAGVDRAGDDSLPDDSRLLEQARQFRNLDPREFAIQRKIAPVSQCGSALESRLLGVEVELLELEESRRQMHPAAKPRVAQAPDPARSSDAGSRDVPVKRIALRGVPAEESLGRRRTGTANRDPEDVCDVSGRKGGLAANLEMGVLQVFEAAGNVRG